MTAIPPLTLRRTTGPRVTCQVLTVSEAASALGISRTLAYELVARRELPAVHLGRRIVIPRQAVDALLASAMADLDGDIGDG
jgi:excisionase family DNA binding protein